YFEPTVRKPGTGSDGDATPREGKAEPEGRSPNDSSIGLQNTPGMRGINAEKPPSGHRKGGFFLRAAGGSARASDASLRRQPLQRRARVVEDLEWPPRKIRHRAYRRPRGEGKADHRSRL